MIFDTDGFEYDPCWDCVYWRGFCQFNGPGHCTGQPLKDCDDGLFEPLIID